MKFSTFSHCGGLEIVSATERAELEKALQDCTVVPALRSAPKIRTGLLGTLVKFGWSNEVAVAVGSQITITSAKNHIGLCLQTGNMSRMYADLMKLQKLFLDGGIKAGVMVVPSATAAQSLGSNIANAERLQKELEIFRKVIHMPIIVLAFE